MGTVGISFGAATSGQGFDVATTVTAIMAAQQGIETPWKSQLSSLTAQDTVLTSLGTDLSTLTTNVQALTDFEGVLAGKEGSSSNTNVLTLTSASSSATAGSHTVVVNSLAQTSSEYSATVTNASDTLSGGFTIQVGTGTAQPVTVSSTNNTLSTLAASINAQAIGVTANVITDSSGSRLELVSSTGGAAGQLTIGGALTDSTTSTAIGFHQGQAGLDASFSVDGISLTSASNTISSAIPGVTMQLLSAAIGTNVQVEIDNNNSAVETAIGSFVTSYNTVMTDINTQEGKDSSGNPEPLYGSPTMALLQEQLSGALLGGAASGSVNSITQLGISVNNDGTLTLDTSALDSELNSNYSDVVGFMQNSGSFGQNFATALNGLGTQEPDGAIYLAQQQNTQQEATLNTSITSENALLATETATLTTELNTANQELQAIPQQLSEVNQIYSAVTGYNQNPSG